AITQDGKRLGVPLATKCVALYVNPKYGNPPRTLAEIEAKKKTLPAGVFPLAYEAQSLYFHAPFLHAYGGQLFAEGTFAMVGPEAEKSVEKVRDLTRDGVTPD